jgi:tRNA-splicing ligase RtcB (3'-phosphate/5'-hydroxy nucleic acid ligase)
MKIFGQHDEQTIVQFQHVRERAVDAALMADGHVGYVMPIGGVAAYRDEVSVVGVGFDIACLAVGSRVSTHDGYTVPIESVGAHVPIICWDDGRVRPVTQHIGAVAKGEHPTVRICLSNGRVIQVTRDHEVRTRAGWKAAGELAAGDFVACTPFVGVPYGPPPDVVEITLRDPSVAESLARRGLWPLSACHPNFATLVRLLGVVSGEGHLTRDAKAVSVYTTDEYDAVDIATDFTRLGFRASVYRRARAQGTKDEICVRVHSIALHALFEALGSPVGRKVWSRTPMPWLFTAPAWVRAQFLSGFASAEMMTPCFHPNGTVPNLQLKQAGEDTCAIDFAAALFVSLGFSVSTAPSGRRYGNRCAYVLQILGGEEEQLRFFSEVGFCYANEKRARAAQVASVVWQHRRLIDTRETAKAEARQLHAAGGNWRAVTRDLAAKYGVSPGFVYHAIYDRRGRSRRTLGAAVAPDTAGEVCWEPVQSVEPAGSVPVYDVVTADTANSFVAEGIVVHNCGNAAIRTDMTLADIGGAPDRLHEALTMLADEIAEAVSFGIGRKNRSDDAPVNHELFDDPAWDAVPHKHRRALLAKAREQLGTVGSGNHYVDVFTDETGALWVGVHFGSRGFGHTVASAFLSLGQGKQWGERVPEREVLLGLEQPIGHDYWHLMNLAGRYAYAGREWVARKVVEILGANEMELVHNHHNFAWKETHNGEEVVVVRKGATPAFPGQKGFVGGSMGDDAVIVQGATPDVASPEIAAVQREALFSTVHGAGRVMSRTAAAGKRNRKTGQVLSPGRVTPEMMHDWVKEKGVILRGGGLDESPHVYRRLPEVLAAQEGTVEVLHTLRPLVVVMAGANEFDPYKD